MRMVGHHYSVVVENDNHDICLIATTPDRRNNLLISKNQGLSYEVIHIIDENESAHIFSPVGARSQLILWENQAGRVLVSRINDSQELEQINNISRPSFDIRQIMGSVVDDTLRLTTYDTDNIVYSSKDTGRTWVEIRELPVTPWGVGMYQSPSDPNLLIIGDTECYVSRNGGATWDKVNSWGEYYSDVDGKLHADMMHFAEFEDKAGQPFLLVSNHGGLNISWDNLNSVHNLSLQNLNVSQYYDVISSPNFPGWIFGGTQDQGFQRGRGLPEENINMEQVISGDYGHMVFGDDQTSMWIVYPFGWISIISDVINGGFAGSYVIESYDEFVWINPTSSIKQEGVNGIYVAGGDIYGGEGSYLIQLTNNLMGGGMQVDQFDYNFKEFTNEGLISAVEVSPINPDVIYVATTNGRFFYSYDRGLTWDQNINFIPEGHYLYGQNVLASSIEENKVWLAGSGYSNPGVYYSEDGGEIFTPMSDGLPQTLVFELAMNEDETFMIAATESGPYMYLFEDEQWYDIAGLSAPNQTYWSVEYLEEEKVARFGTYGRGIWDVELDDLRVVGTEDIWNEKEISIYPNPVVDQLSMVTEMKNDLVANISVTDLHGKVVYSEIKNIRSGRDHISFDVSMLRPGHYFMHVTDKDRRATRKFIKM